MKRYKPFQLIYPANKTTYEERPFSIQNLSNFSGKVMNREGLW